MIRLLLVDDQTLIAQGLQAMLDLEPDLEVVGIANNGQAAIQQVERLQPDVVLMEIKMPVMNGREATRIINQRFPDVKVLVLSTFDEDEYIAQALQAGAKGYLLKDMPCEELAQVIRLVERGYSQMGPGLMEKMLEEVLQLCITGTALTSEPSKLSPRELDVLKLIGTGCTNREIAKQLHITEGTVKAHVTRILNRLNLRNRAQIAVYANSAR